MHYKYTSYSWGQKILIASGTKSNVRAKATFERLFHWNRVSGLSSPPTHRAVRHRG